MKFEYEYEIIDNGVVIADKEIGGLKMAFVDTEESCDIAKQVGAFLYEDIQGFVDGSDFQKFEITINIEPVM